MDCLQVRKSAADDLAAEKHLSAERERRFKEEIARLESALDGTGQAAKDAGEKAAMEIASLKQRHEQQMAELRAHLERVGADTLQGELSRLRTAYVSSLLYHCAVCL